MEVLFLLTKAITTLLNTVLLRLSPKQAYYSHLLYLENPSYFASNPFDLIIILLYSLKISDLGWKQIIVYYIALIVDGLVPKDGLSASVGEIARFAIALGLHRRGLQAFILARCASVFLSTLLAFIRRGGSPSATPKQAAIAGPFWWGIAENAVLRYFLTFDDQILYATLFHYGTVVAKAFPMIPIVKSLKTTLGTCLTFIAPFYTDSLLRVLRWNDPRFAQTLPPFAALLGLQIQQTGLSMAARVLIQSAALVLHPTCLSLLVGQVLAHLIACIQMGSADLVCLSLGLASALLALLVNAQVEGDISKLAVCAVNGLVVLCVLGYREYSRKVASPRPSEEAPKDKAE